MIRTAYLLVAFLAAWSVHAYKEPVHALITSHAVKRLRIDFRSRLGVADTHIINDASFIELTAAGAFDADNLPNPVNHFLDPEHNAALTTRVPYGVCALNGMRAVGPESSFR
jgi:hypothetical protein